MTPIPLEALFRRWCGRIVDCDYGWSIGCAGVSAEFTRDATEPIELNIDDARLEIATTRGALALAPREAVSVHETPDSRATEYCLPVDPIDVPRGVRALGPDREAVRAEDGEAPLYDLGVTDGPLRMCVRTRDPELSGLLASIEGCPLFDHEEVLRILLDRHPHRVMRSPLGRIEVYQPIPRPGGRSPHGPHTHLLPAHMQTGDDEAGLRAAPRRQVVLTCHHRAA